MRIHFGFINCPWSLKKDSRGRSWLKRSDAHFITDRERNGGCCMDFQRSFICARCNSELGFDWDLVPIEDVRKKLRVLWTPEKDIEP